MRHVAPIFTLLPLALLVAACGSAPESPDQAGTALPDTGDPFASEAPLPGPSSAVQTALPRYVGRWAASPAQCDKDWWRFWSDEVVSADGLRCQIMPPDGMSGDTSLRLRCIAKGGKQSSEEWTIGYPAAGRIEIHRSTDKMMTLGKC